MNIVKKVFLVFAALTVMQSFALAGDGHAHGKKGHKHSENETQCAECKDKKDCKCEKADGHDHKEGDGHNHGKKKNKTTNFPR